MIRVTRVRARAVRVPMAEPHHSASGAVSESPLVLVDVETDQGARHRVHLHGGSVGSDGKVGGEYGFAGSRLR
jgi:hypothetical protein